MTEMIEENVTENCKDDGEEIHDIDRIIRHHMYGAAGVGLVPIPLVDLAGLTGVQINMLRKLAKAYDVPFSKDRAKHIIGTMVGSAVPVSISGTVASLIKAIPIIGQTTGAVTMSMLGGASTYALGKAFDKHFSSGGTFLDFDTTALKDYYTKMMKEGEKLLSKVWKRKKGTAIVPSDETTAGENNE